MKKIMIYSLVMLFIGSCELDQKDFKPQDEFVKIYNDPDESIIWYPVGIVQTTDKGFLIVNALKTDTAIVEYPTTAVIKVNQFGELEHTSRSALLSPAPGFIHTGIGFAFAAMDDQNNAFLNYVDEQTGEITDNIDLGFTMPLACNTDSLGRIIVLGYNYVERSSVVALYNSQAGLLNISELKINEDILEDKLQSHLNKTGIEIPFFMGDCDINGQPGFFVNCYKNYTIRGVFFNNDGTPTGGDIFSFQDKYVFSSLLHSAGNNYCFTRYSGGQNFISLDVAIDPFASVSYNDQVQNNLDELVSNAKVIAKKVLFNNTGYMLFVSSTNSNAIVIYQYATDNILEPVHTEYFDFENKIEVVDIIQDENDQGIVILGRIYLTGQYLRPIVVKLKKEEFVN